MTQPKDSIRILAENRKALHDFEVSETFEAGVALTGSEVKSAKAGKIQLTDSYVVVRGNQAFWRQGHIAPYTAAFQGGHEPNRPRVLLLNRHELARLRGLTEKRGYTAIVLKAYLKRGWIKLLIGVGKGRKNVDKRAALKAKQWQREKERYLKRGRW